MGRVLTRRGVAIPIVLGLILVLGLLLHKVSGVQSGEARLSRTQALDAEHLYRAEGIFARLVNRLKKRPWHVRFYARGGPGTGPHHHEEEGAYREGNYTLHVQDVPYEGVLAVPGLVDVFLRFEFQSIERAFHYRLSLLPASLRRRAAIRVEHFGRTGADLSSEASRTMAAAEVTAHMQDAAANQEVSRVLLRKLPQSLRLALVGHGGGEDLDPGELADGLLESEVAEEAAARGAARQELRRSIHLLGNSGKRYSDYLSPLERGRFEYRDPNFSAARAHLKEAVRLSGDDLRLAIPSLVVTSRAYSAEAWQVGPASRMGQELLRRALEALESARDLLAEADDADISELDPTVLVTLWVDRAQVARIMGGKEELVEESLLEAARAGEGAGRIYGGRENPDRIASTAMGLLETEEAQQRIRSRRPLKSSGFEKVTEEEVEGFLNDPGAGWRDYPSDSGKDEEFFEEYWEDEAARFGEGGSGRDSDDVDRDGDGLPDPDTEVDEDADGPPSDGGEEGDEDDDEGGDEQGDDGEDPTVTGEGEAADAVEAALEAADAAEDAADAAQDEADAMKEEAEALAAAGLLDEAAAAAAEAAKLQEAANVAKDEAAEASEAAATAAEALENGDPELAGIAAAAAAGAAAAASEAAAEAGATEEAAEAAKQAMDAASEAADTGNTQGLEQAVDDARSALNTASHTAESAAEREAIASAYAAAAAAAQSESSGEVPSGTAQDLLEQAQEMERIANGEPEPEEEESDSGGGSSYDGGGSSGGGSSGGDSGGGGDPGGSDPGGSDPGGSDPGGSDPGGSDPGGSDPGGSDPGGSDPGGSDPGGSDPGGSDSGGGDSSGGDSGGGDSGGGDSGGGGGGGGGDGGGGPDIPSG